MMQRWSEDAIRFMEDASVYGNYHKELVQELLPFLPKNGHICDAGCGLGHLALELSEACAQVTAVDASANALRGLLSRELPTNLRVLQGDIFTMREHYDAMVFCYFGKTEDILRAAEEQCLGGVLVVRRDCSVHRFSGSTVPRREHSINMLTGVLEDRGIPYMSRRISLELGQPFRSKEDALVFFDMYNKSHKRILLEDLEDKLVQTGDKTFPWYYPNIREMELIVFESENIRKKQEFPIAIWNKSCYNVAENQMEEQV